MLTGSWLEPPFSSLRSPRGLAEECEVDFQFLSRFRIQCINALTKVASPGVNVIDVTFPQVKHIDVSACNMSQELVICNIKAPVPLQVGDMKTEVARPGVNVIDVTFPQVKHIDLQVIQFKNSYTAFLTVRVQQRRPSEVREGPLKWRTCLRNYRLMPNPHTEEGSQEYVSLFRHQMIGNVDQVTALRFILRQPSPVWIQFNLEELQINPCSQKSPLKGFPTWLSHAEKQEPPTNLHDALPDPDKVSTEVQQMWVLTEMIRANQTSNRIGRFDVDGCYDINLLSYT